MIKAMLLAAGRGNRLRPMTNHTPKPLLEVQGKPLLQWHLEALARDGVHEVVINTAWLGGQISDHFGEHPQLPNQASISITYSHEGRTFGDALETAGGIAHALPHLGEVFWVIAGDIFAPQFEFSAQAMERFVASRKLAHLWLVPNPAHHPSGDFGITPEGHTSLDTDERYTYSAIGLFRRELFLKPHCPLEVGNAAGTKVALGPLLRRLAGSGQISAELYRGPWSDIGTVDRLALANNVSVLA